MRNSTRHAHEGVWPVLSLAASSSIVRIMPQEMKSFLFAIGELILWSSSQVVLYRHFVCSVNEMVANLFWNCSVPAFLTEQFGFLCVEWRQTNSSNKHTSLKSSLCNPVSGAITCIHIRGTWDVCNQAPETTDRGGKEGETERRSLPRDTWIRETGERDQHTVTDRQREMVWETYFRTQTQRGRDRRTHGETHRETVRENGVCVCVCRSLTTFRRRSGIRAVVFATDYQCFAPTLPVVWGAVGRRRLAFCQ